MDNQQNQPGPMPGDDVRVQNAGTNMGSTGLGNDATVSGAASRKGTRSPQQPTDATDTTATSQAGSEGQQENQASSPEGTLLDTALNSGKQWIEDSGVLKNVNQLPQSLKDFGTRALDKVNGLTTTQKVVGGALLAAGIGWLATRKGKSEGGESSPYNYGRQRDAGSYGRRSYGYQAPDASTSRRPEAGSGRSDSGAPYGSGGNRYGSSSYGSDAKSANSGIKSGSGRTDSSHGGASASTDHGSQHSSNSFRSKDDGFRSIE